MSNSPENNGKAEAPAPAAPVARPAAAVTAPAGSANPTVANAGTAAAPAKPSAAAKPATPAAATPKPAPAPAAPPPPPPVPSALTKLPIPFQGADYSLRGYHADATVAPHKVAEAAQILDKEGFSLDTITGVDWMAQGQMEIVYDYFHPDKTLRVVIRTRVPRDNPELPTISKVFPGANWHERETHDFFGIRFAGHPDLSPFLLPEDATYHPLRKDFTSC